MAHILGTRPQSGQDLKAYAGKPLLQVNDLQIHFHTSRGVARVVDGTTLTLNHGEILGIAGESGSGKTTLVEAILQIVRFPNREARGEVLFSPGDHDPVDLMTLSQEQMRPWRGRHIAYVPQGSQNSLNPIDRIGRQIVLGMTEHGISEREAEAKVPELLEKVGLDAKVARLYPHELSGGMKQRAIIAMAISMDPELIIADEPTTALDVNVQRLIIDSLKRLREEMGIAIMMVSHDLPVHAQLVDRLGVMYAGQIVEAGGVREVMKQSLHPYSDGLISSVPRIGGPRVRLEGIRGGTPSPLAWPPACRFHNRCPHKMPICEKVAPTFARVQPGPREIAGRRVDVDDRHFVACHLHPESRPEGGTEPADLRQVEHE